MQNKMVRLEHSETAQPKKSKKRPKEKIRQEGNFMSPSIEKNEVAHNVTATEEEAMSEKKCENGAEGLTESRKSKKKKRMRDLTESSDCPQITTSKAEALSREKDNKCENGSEELIESRKSKKKKRKLELPESSNCLGDSQIVAPKDETISSDKDGKKWENGVEESTESRESKKKKRKQELTQSSNCLDDLQFATSKAETTSSEKTEQNSAIGAKELTESRKSKRKKQQRELNASTSCSDNLRANILKTETISTVNAEKKCDAAPEESKESQKSKKKKLKQETEQSSCLDDSQMSSTARNENHDEIEPKFKKSKKRRKKEHSDTVIEVTQKNSELPEVTVVTPNREDAETSSHITESPSDTIETKKSKKRKKTDLNENIVNGAPTPSDSCNVLPVKKRKKHTSEANNDVQSKENIPSNENLQKVKKKKSKKVSKSIETSECLLIDPNEQISAVKDTELQRKANEDVEMATPASLDDISSKAVAKKKKKMSKNKDESHRSNPMHSDHPETNSSEPKEKVKRKKKSKDSASPNVADGHISDIVQERSVTIENDELEAEHNVTPKPKKQKKAKKAAQETQNVDSSQAVDDDLGQWKTAELSSSAHEKFARLLGARKKRYRTVVTPLSGLKAGESVLSKLTGVWTPPPERRLFGSLQVRDKKFAKMAMDQKETAKLNESLETQFNKTLDFNLQKRKEGNAAKGLGFQEDPAKGKKHYIDIHKVKSTVLD